MEKVRPVEHWKVTCMWGEFLMIIWWLPQKGGRWYWCCTWGVWVWNIGCWIMTIIFQSFLARRMVPEHKRYWHSTNPLDCRLPRLFLLFPFGPNLALEEAEDRQVWKQEGELKWMMSGRSRWTSRLDWVGSHLCRRGHIETPYAMVIIGAVQSPSYLEGLFRSLFRGEGKGIGTDSIPSTSVGEKCMMMRRRYVWDGISKPGNHRASGPCGKRGGKDVTGSGGITF